MKVGDIPLSPEQEQNFRDLCYRDKIKINQKIKELILNELLTAQESALQQEEVKGSDATDGNEGH